MNQNIRAGEAVGARLIARPRQTELIDAPFFTFDVECRRDGKRIWRDQFRNTVMTAGKNDLLDKYFGGSSYTAAWYMGLIQSDSYSAIAAGDTMASHAGWQECTSYDESARPTCAFSAASSGSKALSSALAFTISASKTVKGAFIVTNATKGGTSGILYSAGLFTGGDRVVVDNDVISVSGSWSAS